MNPIAQVLNQIVNPKFDPDYVLEKFGTNLVNIELLNLALDVIENSKSLFDFQMKIKELILTDFDSKEGCANNFIQNSPYYYDRQTDSFNSSISSLWENLLKFDYKFPKFLNSLNNEFNFNYVKWTMIKKYAIKSMEIHERLNKNNPGYTFHTLSKAEMEIVSNEIYQMYCIVQQFMQNLNVEQKNYINIVQNHHTYAMKEYYDKNKYIVSRKTFENAQEEFVTKYKTNPPEILFGKICEL